MAYKSYAGNDEVELVSLKNSEHSANAVNENETTERTKTNKKSERTVNFSSDIDINGNKMTRVKNVQFSSPEVSFDADLEIAKPNLVPNRKREEETVMELLRKRVGDLQLDKNFKRDAKQEATHVADKKRLMDEVNETLNQTTDMDFVLDNLCWHNEYRARHLTPALTLSSKLCEHAQQWANHLAHLNELFYCGRDFNFGQSIFCCPETSLFLDLSGQEVATYWYSSIKRYNYNKSPSLLHTNVNAWHFTQIVWKSTRYMGVGKANSRSGKVFVVAFYYPPGNIIDEFESNVLPLEKREEYRPSSVTSLASK